jgi:hypothetical protein
LVKAGENKMAFVEKERYLFLVHPVQENEIMGFQQTNILAFYSGFVNVREALNDKISTLEPTYLQVVSDQVAKQRKFTLVKPTDDITFMLLRASLKETQLKAALIFGTTNLNFVLSMQTPDAKVEYIGENQNFKNAKADVIHFSFGQMIMTSEISLAQANGR